MSVLPRQLGGGHARTVRPFRIGTARCSSYHNLWAAVPGCCPAAGSRPYTPEAFGVPVAHIGSAAIVSSYTRSSLALSKIISWRVRPTMSYVWVSSIASTGQASSHMPQ